jgi:hypothetical protein
MVDLQVIEIRDVLLVSGVRPVPGFTPRTIRVYGKDFRSVYEVYVNDALSPSVFVITNQEMLVQVPTSLGRAPIRTVQAISNKLTNTDRSKITFRIGDTTSGVSGMTRLVQTFLKLLLQTPGRDIFAWKLGGGLLRTVARQTTRGGGSMVADLTVGVERASRQLMNLQSANSALPLTERLLFAHVIEAKFIQSELALVGRIGIGNQARQRGVVALGL